MGVSVSISGTRNIRIVSTLISVVYGFDTNINSFRLLFSFHGRSHEDWFITNHIIDSENDGFEINALKHHRDCCYSCCNPESYEFGTNINPFPIIFTFHLTFILL